MPTKINRRYEFMPSELKIISDNGLFNQDHPLSKNLAKLLNRMNHEGFSVWSENLNDFINPPKTNAGMSVCWECGRLYAITPVRDAFKVEGREGSICYVCITRTT